MDQLVAVVQSIFGTGAEALSVGQMSARAAVVYIVALALVRTGHKRFMGRNTAFDVALAIIFGSVVSRAITGNAPFWPTLAAGLALVLVHWLFAALTYYLPATSPLIEGRPRVLVRDGAVQRDQAARGAINEHDLNSALRLHGRVTAVGDVELAHLERNGEISVIPRPREPLVVDLGVADGVQHVRIELRRG